MNHYDEKKVYNDMYILHMYCNELNKEIWKNIFICVFSN